MTDSVGTKVVDYTYEAYGKATNDNAASTNRFQYMGRENDTINLRQAQCVIAQRIAPDERTRLCTGVVLCSATSSGTFPGRCRPA